MKKQRYIWQVECMGRPTVEVTAVDKLEAVQAAARVWGVSWTQIARDCDFVQLRKEMKNGC